jgi:hypothetical protein
MSSFVAGKKNKVANRIVSFAVLFLSVFIFTGCAVLKESPKYGFNEGYYKSRLFKKKLKKVYVVPVGDSINVYSAKKLKAATVDATQDIKIAFPLNEKPEAFTNYIFRKNSFDIDVLSILFKYRPTVNGFPPQLSTSILNGALYLGYRTDIYKLKYKQNPLKKFKRNINHYGFSIGVFGGISASRIDENSTMGRLNYQYDGFIIPTGISAIIALDKLSFGIMGGIDELPDKNSKVWIYNGKPWIGLSVGLNLN